MISRRFRYMKDESVGEMGFAPAWVKFPEYFIVGGTNAAHDILEHCRSDDGGAECEFMALGGLVYIRGPESGYLTYVRGFTRDPADDIAGDCMSIMQRVDAGEQTMKDPGHVAPIRNREIERIFLDGARKGREQTNEEYCEDPDYPVMTAEHERRIVGWLRKGYRRTVRRFQKHDRHMDAYDLSMLFDSVKKRFDEFTKNAERTAYEGQEIVVRIDVRARDVQIDYVKESNKWH